MRLGFVAVRGLGKGEVLEGLGEMESEASSLQFGCVGVSPEGWTIVVKPDPEFPTPDLLASVSSGGTAVGYSADTVVMYSTAAGYEDGREAWWIEHNGEDGDVDHLRTRGEPPPGFEAIVAAARKTQTESEDRDTVDYIFNVTEEVVFSICGFHPERETTIEFKALKSQMPPRKPGLLARLLGAS